METLKLDTPLVIKGHIIKNRMAKGALSEGVATIKSGHVTKELLTLYNSWAEGGIGLSITGNVMIDVNAKNEPGNVVIEDEVDLSQLKQWAKIGKKHNVIQIVQISHPGKQCPKGLNKETVAPSPIGFGAALSSAFGVPRELTEKEILGLIKRFGNTAKICEKAGFEGVQLHGAHGYLISQFLSPRHNQRTDKWGGSFENRMRFVLECYKEVKRQTSESFIIGIKLNSSDFQKGGHNEEEAAILYKKLDVEGIDFIEVSGGTYEAGAMMGAAKGQKESTRKREAYFLEFAKKIRSSINTVLMVTGGFRTNKIMEEAINSGSCDLIGIARPLIIDPATPEKILKGGDANVRLKPVTIGVKKLDGMIELIWNGHQIRTLAKGKTPNPDISPILVLIIFTFNNFKKVIQGRIKMRA
jgi:2,4-dienoyl-CoA reductase-like NADH-dependent reductase (Old Yellow Enzyme family)